MIEDDILLAMQAALVDTKLFDEVSLKGLPEVDGSSMGASDLGAAAIDPISSTENDLYDGGENTSGFFEFRCLITVSARENDQWERDVKARSLVAAAGDALQGQSLAGFTCPDKTKFVGWKYLSAVAPERRIEIQFTCTYQMTSWTGMTDDEPEDD